MSIRVTIEDLQAELVNFPAAPYLLTVNDDGRPHSVASPISWHDGRVVLAPGNRTLQNAAARPLVALVFAPTEADGYSLIVDAVVVETRLDGAGDNELVIEPTGAVLHRPAPVGMEPTSPCGSDCLPVGATPKP